ncbi:hypothetical protein LWI29_013244 [Acer saccharum]|uniref:rRNA-processing protein FYV7 n=1 Tax=Acer saccharum TaxID=4024 RepID=A0AA39VI58_ACESA|nr:hypothetical protein LWI29_013244 [Acer saccharum]KAK1559783.1 hypothetical protein Q3G72_018209 [Acer saccharum]
MKQRDSKDEEKVRNINTFSMKKKKNMQRLGGTGLSLEAFANAKSVNNHHNPAFKKKQREFYKNAKFVNKYKKSVKQLSHPNDVSSAAVRHVESQTEDGNKKNMKNKKKKKPTMEILYEKKREEEEKARIEREAMIKAKKEGREKAEARRKSTRDKMFKKTQHGQPVMKYRIEHLLETIQGSVHKLD